MKRAGGDALVLRTGESPHVLTGGGRQNVARAVLSANALEALVTQIFSEAGRQTLREAGQVVEEVTVSGGLVLSASAERTPDYVMIELRESAPAPVEAAPAPEPEAVEEPAPVAQESDDVAPVASSEPPPWYEVSVGGSAEGAFDAVPSFAVSADPLELRDAPVHEIAPTELEPLESTNVQYRGAVPAGAAGIRCRRSRPALEYPETPDDTAAVPEPKARPGHSVTRSSPSRSSIRCRFTRSPP